MSHVSASFSATIRVRLFDQPGSFARVAQAIGAAGGSLGAIDGIEVERVSDRTFLMHLGGKIEMRSKVQVKTRDDLSMA